MGYFPCRTNEISSLRFHLPEHIISGHSNNATNMLRDHGNFSRLSNCTGKKSPESEFFYVT